MRSIYKPGAAIENPPYQLSLFSASAIADYPGFPMSVQNVRAFEMRLDSYLTYCQRKHFEVLTPTSAQSFLEHFARTHSYEYIRRMVDNLRLYFRIANVPDPFTLPTRELLIPFEARCIPSRMHCPTNPTSVQQFRTLIESIPCPGTSLRDVRERALLLLIFAAFLTGVEIEALDASDVDFAHDFGAEIYISGRQQSVPMPHYPEIEFCVVTALKAWVSRAGITEGALFRPIAHDRIRHGRLIATSVAALIRKRFVQAGLPVVGAGVNTVKWGAIVTAIRRGVDPHVLHRMSGMAYGTIQQWTDRATAHSGSSDIPNSFKRRR